MHILLITITYPPEIRAISLMMREIAEELKLRGHKVTVLTSAPRGDLIAHGERHHFPELLTENGVKVVRVKNAHRQKHSYVMRGIAEVMLPRFFFMALKKYLNEKIDAVVVYSPPLPLAMLGIKIKKRYGAKYLLNVQDIFPQNAIDLDIIRNRFLISYFEWMEKRAYIEADRITAHSPSNSKFLMHKKKVPKKKIGVVYNWIDLTPYKKIDRTEIFRKRYGLGKKFILLHAGIMGPAQGLAFIIQVAREVKAINDICFLLIGDGSQKKKLMEMANDYGLSNVIFKPFVSKQEYPFLAKDADVGLVCLSDRNKTPVYPGKLLGYMAASIPVVAFLNNQSDGHHIIQEAKCGYSLVSGNYRKAAELIIKVYNEKETLERLGHNGYKYALSHFSKKACIDKLEKLIQ